MASLPELLRWFRPPDRLDRRTYIVRGTALAAIKYAVDATVIRFVLGRLWTPLDYLSQGVALDVNPLRSTSAWLLLLFGLWTIPFLWIGMTMTARRALDVGWPPWVALFFFVPWANYALIATLCVAPSSRAVSQSRSVARERKATSGELAAAVAVGSGIGLLVLALSVYALSDYGAALFMGTPFIMGAAAALVLNRPSAVSARQTRNAALLSIASAGLATLVVAMEGAVCLIMAAPLAVGLAVLGADFGRWIAATHDTPTSRAMLAALALPMSAMLESPASPRELREVLSVVEIDAPPDVVWRHVVSFPELAPPTELVFRMGIAYPMSARIEGTGVGAVRHCAFSTGAFVEPITVWEPGRRLAFDVTDQPAPLKEWSPYPSVSPPHLDGFFHTRRGEFRLIPLPGGRTRLEGRTWYELEIFPEAYWMPISDVLIGRIHHRVLMHIGRLAESDSSTRPPDVPGRVPTS
jgi:uncharacterized membrane protein YhaH (DUF805 family)